MRRLLLLSVLACLFGLSAVPAWAAGPDGAISYQHIRNATARINYAGAVFLIDPFLAAKGAYPGFEGTPNSERRIPLIDMAAPIEEVVKDIDAVILTHTHLDHWDEAAQRILPKDVPFFVQNAKEHKMEDRVFVPREGETLRF